MFFKILTFIGSVLWSHGVLYEIGEHLCIADTGSLHNEIYIAVVDLVSYGYYTVQFLICCKALAINLKNIGSSYMFQ